MKNVIPDEIKSVLNDLAHQFEELLKDNFVGFYIHGSIAMGCFNFQESDIDFLVVTKDSLDKETKQEIIKMLLRGSEKAPSKGFEMSIIKQSEIDNFKHPALFELHFSNSYIERYRTDPEYICGDDKDVDLAAHLMITKKRGICLLGKRIDQVFQDISVKYYLDSILQDSLNSLKDISNGPNKGFCDVPTYAVLNLCRVIAFIKRGKIFSKLEGGKWGIEKLPRKYHDLIQQALNKYSSRPTKKVQADVLKNFGDYAKKYFKKTD